MGKIRKYTLLLILAIATMVLLFGCTTAPVKSDPVVEIPSVLLEECYTNTPPAIDLYTRSSFSEREQLLSMYIRQLLVNLYQCNDQIKAIRQATVAKPISERMPP